MSITFSLPCTRFENFLPHLTYPGEVFPFSTTHLTFDLPGSPPLTYPVHHF